MSARYLLICDGCAEQAPRRSEKSIKNARKYNALLGWTHPKPGYDYCARCSAPPDQSSEK